MGHEREETLTCVTVHETAHRQGLPWVIEDIENNTGRRCTQTQNFLHLKQTYTITSHIHVLHKY